jgi:16S rRNA (adenine1518-N6/adenine1519-N6)-dimethyltransferase
MSRFAHNKRFGQHFLRDQSILRLIASYGHLNSDSICIEVGPGQGALTHHLIATGANIIAIELDTRLENRLNNLAQKHINFSLNMGDALVYDFDMLVNHQPFSLISNLPYEISTPMIFKLAKCKNLQAVVLLLQQEVVMRMCADVGSSNYGRLSVMSQYYFNCEALVEVGPECFSPPPKVMSQVVRCIPKPRHDNIDDTKLEDFVKVLFAHRRKMIRQLFKNQLSDVDWQELGIDSSARPQSLSIEEIIRLFQYCQ